MIIERGGLHAVYGRRRAKKVYKITRAQLKAHGRSSLLPTPGTSSRVLARVEEYNAPRPTVACPLMVDAAQARRRHMSPNEYWQHCLGRVFDGCHAGTARRPVHARHHAQGAERHGAPTGDRDYFAHELANHHGDLVEVRYDVWDASYVSVWTEAAGEKICRGGAWTWPARLPARRH